jgi:hypothetical protein
LPHPAVSHPALDAFAEVAAGYCRFVEKAADLSASQFLQEAHRLLPSLYAAGLALPGTGILFPDRLEAGEGNETSSPAVDSAESSDPDRGSSEELRSIFASLSAKLGSREQYREVYDPYDPPEEKEVIGSLADDLVDIYSDLQAGLRKWGRGDSGEALWEWRFGLEIHWGRHLVGALRALHALAASYETDWPDPSSAAT